MNALWEKIVRDAGERVKAAFRAGKTAADGIDMTAALTVYAEPPDGTPETWFCADVTLLAAMALQELEQPPKISKILLRLDNIAGHLHQDAQEQHATAYELGLADGYDRALCDITTALAESRESLARQSVDNIGGDA